MDYKEILRLVNNTEIIDTHEHIGSIKSVGFCEQGFTADHERGAAAGDTTIFDLIFSPYFHGLLKTTAFDINAVIKDSENKDRGSLIQNNPRKLWRKIRPYLMKTRGTGLFRALNIALKELYDMDLISIKEEDIITLSKLIADNYQTGGFEWYQEVFDKCRIKKVIKPVHTSYFVSDSESVNINIEKKLFAPVARIDDLLDWTVDGPGPDLEKTFSAVDFRPETYVELDNFIDRVFDLYERGGAVGIKQLQAYSRSLRFEDVDDEKGKEIWGNLNNNPAPDIIKEYQNLVMHKILKKCDALEWPFQIHTGMANLPLSNPHLLQNLFPRYPRVDFVLLHCYPYTAEAAYLARSFANVYLDTAWLSLQGPAILEKALQEWMGFVPFSKIFISQDATSIEECYGATKISCKVLAGVLAEKSDKGYIDDGTIEDTVKAVLGKNAGNLYFDK